MVLAAGEARRFGGAKVLARVGGPPLVRLAADAAQAAGLVPIVVVTGALDAEVTAALEGAPARTVRVSNPGRGLAHSIACGLRELRRIDGTARARPIRAAILVHADRPFPSAGLLRALVGLYERTGRHVAAPSFRGTLAPPVLFDRAVWPELEALRGDVGGRAVALRDPSRLALLAVDAPPPSDVDTPEDLREARARQARVTGRARRR